MKKELVQTSKFLSLILRHKPQLIGLTLAQNGWVEIDVLIDAANRHGRQITRELIDETVFTNDKQRFSYSSDGLMIRANQGHSINVDLALEAVEPPAKLYHGTVDRFLDSIKKSGLQKMQRQHVHLSATIEAATSVGARRGQPIILVVDAKRMHAEGYSFYLSANGVWLTDSVPWAYIELVM